MFLYHKEIRGFDLLKPLAYGGAAVVQECDCVPSWIVQHTLRRFVVGCTGCAAAEPRPAAAPAASATEEQTLPTEVLSMARQLRHADVNGFAPTCELHAAPTLPLHCTVFAVSFLNRKAWHGVC